MTAQTAAREIAAKVPMAGHIHSEAWWLPVLTPIIQQAIDEAVKEERERYLALAMKWRANTREDPFVKQVARPFIEALESLTGGSP